MAQRPPYTPPLPWKLMIHRKGSISTEKGRFATQEEAENKLRQLSVKFHDSPYLTLAVEKDETV